ncbi:hypothetical protein PUN28_018051 [Cardiocondyla obscurior]|uniref:Transmembrane protein n=1 Tax=Cardiocondyla obscurior TaxID=286306 RepID=A0AAW2EJE7_9HYME
MRAIYSTLNAVTFARTASRKTRTLPNSRSRSTFALLSLRFRDVIFFFFSLHFATGPACASFLPPSPSFPFYLAVPCFAWMYPTVPPATLEQNPRPRRSANERVPPQQPSASHCSSILFRPLVLDRLLQWRHNLS